MTESGPMTCRELVEFVTDYLEGALPPRDRARFENHLPNCRGCADYVEQIRTAIRASGALHEEELDPRMRDELVALFANWKRNG